MNWILRHPFQFALAIITCFFIVNLSMILIFTMPAIVSRFDLSSVHGIGETIGGISAPIVGLVSSLLLFFALIFQIRANREQKLKNESDIIFLLLGQLSSEINNFYYTHTVKGIRETLYGFEALNMYVYEFCNFNWPSIPFGKRYGSVQVSVLIDSMSVIEKRISTAQIESSQQDIFREKLTSYYENYLSHNFKLLDDAFEKEPTVKDLISDKIQNYFRKMGGKPIEDFLDSSI